MFFFCVSQEQQAASKLTQQYAAIMFCYSSQCLDQENKCSVGEQGKLCALATASQ